MLNLATYKYRWVALVVISLTIAIVIIDNTVLNVAVPYILRDLHTTLDAIQWVISGYALIIATTLIPAARLGDMFGRKRILILGTVLFAIGSFIASIAPNIVIMFIGEALIEAIGAAMMLTSTLALISDEFRGRERAIAFGVWGAVAGVSATVGPLLGGYFTTYHSWRWSLRINVFVAIIAIAGSVFVKASKGNRRLQLDIPGMIYSGLGLFSLVFGFIEGQKYGWWKVNQVFNLGIIHWGSGLSVVPIAFLLAVVFLTLFVRNEISLEKQGKTPLLPPKLFKNMAFTAGLITLGIASLGQFGTFFILPIYLQNVLNKTALQTGEIFLPLPLTILIVGPLSGFIASKIRPRWVVSIGMFALAIGVFWLSRALTADATAMSLMPCFILFGIGLGASTAQLTNVLISAVPHEAAGEASAANNVMRQLGASIGIAVLGVILASSLTSNVKRNINNDAALPAQAKSSVLAQESNFSVERQDQPNSGGGIEQLVRHDFDESLTDAARLTMAVAAGFIMLGAISSLFIPATDHNAPEGKPAAKPAH